MFLHFAYVGDFDMAAKTFCRRSFIAAKLTLEVKVVHRLDVGRHGGRVKCGEIALAAGDRLCAVSVVVPHVCLYLGQFRRLKIAVLTFQIKRDIPVIGFPVVGHIFQCLVAAQAATLRLFFRVRHLMPLEKGTTLEVSSTCFTYEVIRDSMGVFLMGSHQ